MVMRFGCAGNALQVQTVLPPVLPRDLPDARATPAGAPAVCRRSRTGTGARMTDDRVTDDVLDDDLESDETESDDTDDDFERAPQPGNVPAPERPLFDPDADDGEEE